MSADKSKTLLLGVDLGGTDTKLGLVSDAGKILDQMKIPTRADKPARDVIERIAAALKKLLKRNRVQPADILGIGFGSPGPLSTKRGVVIDTPNLGWKNVPVRTWLRELIDLPMVLHNDANAAAYGEFWKGAGRGSEVMVLYTLGTGVGGGICLNNDLWVGPGENAAELGHMVINFNGPQCPCGNYGCLEAHASAKAVVRNALGEIAMGRETSLRKLKLEDVTAKRVFEAAKAGDKVAQRIFHRVGWALGLASGNLVNILNAEMFVFGGAMSGAWEFLYDAIVEGCRASILAMPISKIKFVRAQLGENAGIIGAAGLALKEFGA
ncbi:MAG: ROK family protein [Candidatus Sumerlaeia bacterium]|nr:ROK family protein [Candidatus Sumerlaeia bacterium]